MKISPGQLHYQLIKTAPGIHNPDIKKWVKHFEHLPLKHSEKG